ncbi:CarboxypepD_reg-like domain-containing protein [Gillisia sp. Hel1_33_143]|uniref:carboxypeptidase-like regulatory domain-containing protein n=1 Tax=Gillisia sp. Hel1_33_143 TaxID=1336796 RepID=UPI00087CFE0C|nr:carboxypeptidase-like regulatory domain-containing protein [Gillisia sp. Hel1_33_143]SDS65391.1 CarboxypepD_reg-like domain-containing protein [Gillisia sp. Hel1_33_143]
MNKNSLALIFFLILFSTGFLQGQEILGNISDEKNNEPLPYVNIGIPNKNFGTVSDENGNFKLKLNSEIEENDTIVFSYIGYNSIKKLVSELKIQTNTLMMTPDDNNLGEVVFKTKKLKEKRLGRTNKGLGLMHWNFYSSKEKDVDDRLSKEVGMNFKLRRNCRLENFNFAITSNEFKSLKFRINIYDIKNDKPDSLIITENIIFELKDQILGWNSIDLNPYNIYLKQDLEEFVVTIQWVESKKENKKSKFFGIPASTSPFHKIYYREKAMDDFESQT